LIAHLVSEAVKVNVASLGFVALIDIVLAFVLVRVITSSWVREAADAYAERLLESTETLS
jgi:hypothetical protein